MKTVASDWCSTGRRELTLRDACFVVDADVRLSEFGRWGGKQQPSTLGAGIPEADERDLHTWRSGMVTAIMVVPGSVVRAG
jgi:hypothetical protein